MVSPNQFTILESLIGGPRWKRSFATVARLLEDLLAQGLVEPCRPHMGRGRNMVRLTAAGCALLEIDMASVPLERARPDGEIPPLPSLGEVNPDAEPKDRYIGETYRRRVLGGEDPQVVVGQLAERRGLKRPAIHKALRRAGVLPPYQKHGSHCPGPQPAQAPKETPRPVNRDACPYCATRADVGCRHQVAA